MQALFINDHIKRLRVFLAALMLGLAVSCRTPATQIQLFIDTDAPLDRAVSVEVISFNGVVPAEELLGRAGASALGSVTLARDNNGGVSFVAGGSVGVIPPTNRMINNVTVWLRASVAASAVSPEIRIDRAVTVSFVRGRSGTARVFLPISCGDRSVGCVSVGAQECTVSVRCREQNATCGDVGECVALVVPVEYPSLDGAVDDVAVTTVVDATTGRVDATSSLDARADVPVDQPQELDTPPMCPAGTPSFCAGACVDTATSISHCGRCNNRCTATAPNTPICTAGACSLRCAPGLQLVGSRCVSATAAPRPLVPMSLGSSSLRRPNFRWALTAEFDGAMIEVCRDRACTMVIEAARVTGFVFRPTNPLPARSVVFWRMRGLVGMDASTTLSPTWSFHVPAVDASNNVDTSTNPHCDVNGDGFDDVVVGAYGADPSGRTTAGGASVYHGGPGGVSPIAASVIEGVNMNDQLGRSVACAGDVNGDGYGDVILGAAQADPGGRFAAGTAAIFHGSAAGLSAAPALVLNGVASNDNFGWSVAGAGDVNNDGYADVVVGAPLADPGGRSQAGTVSVFGGSPVGIVVASVRTIDGLAQNDNFGWSVASAGDVNGDVYSDLVVGAVRASPSAMAEAGMARIFHGSLLGVSAIAQQQLPGSAAGDLFGGTVACAGDLNNDGYSDVVVGADSASPGGRALAGSASVFHGSGVGVRAAMVQQMNGVAAGDRMGASVASAGDLNGDGYGDLVLGADQADPGGRANAGAASVYHGSAIGVPSVPTLLIEGSLNNDRFGSSVARAGDINGDGYGDVLVGAWLGDPRSRQDVGSASIYHGGIAGLAGMPAVVLEGALANDYFGASVANMDVRTNWRTNGPTGWRTMLLRASLNGHVATTARVRLERPLRLMPAAL